MNFDYAPDLPEEVKSSLKITSFSKAPENKSHLLEIEVCDGVTRPEKILVTKDEVIILIQQLVEVLK